MTSVAASALKTLAFIGTRSAESRTTRSGDAPGTMRTVNWGSSRRMVPMPTTTASQAARIACEIWRSASPLIHWESPLVVAMRPSRVWAYFSTTYGRSMLGSTWPSKRIIPISRGSAVFGETATPGGEPQLRHGQQRLALHHRDHIRVDRRREEQAPGPE